MNSKQLLQLIGVLVIILLLANLILFAMKIINWLLFWTIIILAAIWAYKVLPKMKR